MEAPSTFKKIRIGPACTPQNSTEHIRHAKQHKITSPHLSIRTESCTDRHPPLTPVAELLAANLERPSFAPHPFSAATRPRSCYHSPMQLVRTPLVRALLAVAISLTPPFANAAPRPGISYKPTPSGGRACFVDGVFAYEMPAVPKGYWGSTYGTKDTALLKDGPVDQSDWSAYLQSIGLVLPKRSSATFYPKWGHLVLVTTREKHDQLMKLVGLEPKS